MFSFPLVFMSSVNNQEHQDLAMRQLKLRCKIREINNQAANFWCDEYCKLLLLLPRGQLHELS